MLLKQQSQPLSLKQIADLLVDKHADRTISCWLSDLIAQNLIQRFGAGRAIRYQIVSASQTNAINFSDTAQMAMAAISQPLFNQLLIIKTGLIAMLLIRRNTFTIMKSKN